MPALIPESYEGKYGEIFYEALAVHEIPWAPDEKGHASFTVKRHNNITSKNFHEPINVEKIVNFFTGFSMKACKVNVELPNGDEYAAGSGIPVKVKIDNESSVKIKNSIFKVQQVVTYTSTGVVSSVKEEREELTRVEKNVEEDEIEAIIPLSSTMIKSNSNFSKVVGISHALIVELEVDHFHLNPKIQIPIGIGEKYVERKNDFKKFLYFIIAVFLTLILIFAVIIAISVYASKNSSVENNSG